MSYEVKIAKQVIKDLENLNKQDKEKILKSIYLLATNPHPAASTKLVNRAQHRLRVGRYRVIYEIHNNELLIIVIKVGHRRNVYEN